MDLLRRAFRDIAAGHTRGPILGRTAFIKHLSYADQCEFDAKREEFHTEALKQGILTDQQRLAALRTSGEWTDAQDLAVTRARQFIGELEEGKRKHLDKPSMVKSYVAKIADAHKDYEEKALARRRLMGLTCEVAAEREVNDFYILANVFNDAALSAPFFKDEDFEYLRDVAVAEIVADYNRVMDGCSEANVKKLAMQPFFQRYFQLAGDDFTTLFGKPICALTFYQVDLLRYGAHFRHIYGSHDVSLFPKAVMEDPDLLTDYAEAATKGKAKLAEQGANQDGTIVVGMKKEDAKVMGVTSRNAMAEILKKGGNVMEWAATQGQ